MIELLNDTLIFTFPEVHPQARLRIKLQRTLRIPDDGRNYPLPPASGGFPLFHVDDYPEKIPGKWIEHGGVMFPMYQSEAMWIRFRSDWIHENEAKYPFAVKIATGKINAVTGETWSNGLQAAPQDYMVIPTQPWLDGYCVGKGIIRQFVAMPLGSGYTAEEQVSGDAEYGGLQIIVYPMKRDVFERRFSKESTNPLFPKESTNTVMCYAGGFPDMGLAPGGKMKQEIYDDSFGINDWDNNRQSRCFLHIANSLIWRSITGKNPPTVPFTSKEYNDAGLPWFEYYSDNPAISGSASLDKMKSISTMACEKSEIPLPENQSVTPENIKVIRKCLARNQVREGAF